MGKAEDEFLALQKKAIKVAEAIAGKTTEDSIDDAVTWEVIMKAWEDEDEENLPTTDKEVVKGMIHIQCDLMMQLLQTRQHHWHVQGIVFRDVHLMFDEATEELLEMIDDMSERIVAAGAIAPTNPKTFMEISDIPLLDEDSRDARDMLQQSIDAVKDIIDDIKELNGLADDAGEVGIVNMIGGIAQDLEKLLYKYQQFMSVF
jgi:starvation-inducible DNA-binding protein